MIRFTIYTYLFKPINEPQEPDMFSPIEKHVRFLEYAKVVEMYEGITKGQGC